MRITYPLAAITLAIAALSGPALAGSYPAGHAQMSVNVADDGGFNWDLNLSPFASYDAQSGNFSLDLSTVQTPVSDLNGQWSLGSTQVYDTTTDTLKTVQGLSWHSWTTVDGSTGSGVADANNPWRTKITFAAIGNIDPEMSYGFFAKNNSNSTQVYTVSYGESISPDINGPYTLHADISGSVTNPTGTAGVSVSQVPGFTKIQAVRLSSDGGVTFVNGGVDVGNAYTSSLVGSQPYGNDGADTVSTGAYNYWDFKTQFRLSAKDTFSLTGYAEITPVPEPASWMLPIIGMVGLAAQRRRLALKARSSRLL
ncbi:MAG: hypothetical protein V4532_02715 [Pseudomonadota bacterium]